MPNSSISISLRNAFIAFPLLLMTLSAPQDVIAQDAEFDLKNFSCWKIRRSGDELELDRLTSEGPVPTAYQCTGRSCVNREFIEAKDGTVSEIYRHIYFPRDRSEYVSTWAMWKENAKAPAIHRPTVYQLIECD